MAGRMDYSAAAFSLSPMRVFVVSRTSGQRRKPHKMLPVGREKAARRGSRAVSSSRRRQHCDADGGTAAVDLSAVGEWRPRRSSFRATGASWGPDGAKRKEAACLRLLVVCLCLAINDDSSI
ncbi:hypothetical protein PVAP13_6KG308600 [Panicum virgatum]|uniref:Uncharacterized protein n=1 Tax=Panicum virgatum TaxID=38727 RepID=A0A8T0REY1_PANVG|nr:hypothetical protein PVAP13_6KG308600 [Panicum virgatum]